jgi:hypothetical protein
MTTDLIYIIVLALVAICAIVYSIVKIIKNKWISILMGTIKQAIQKAEASHKSGSEKKEMVLADVSAKCTESGIPFQLIIKTMSKLIDQIIQYYNIVKK